MSAILANSSASASGGMGMFGMIIWLVVIFGFMYFLMIRPQKKEQKKKDLMLSEVWETPFLLHPVSMEQLLIL